MEPRDGLGAPRRLLRDLREKEGTSMTEQRSPYCVRGDDPPTPDQLAVLSLLAVGATLQEAAQTLGYDRRTIHKRMRRLYDRLGLTAAQTLILAGANGWVKVERMERRADG
jgi:DNA-binding NarL/FixJ family response regulator